MEKDVALSCEERVELERRIGAELSKLAEKMDILRLREWIMLLEGPLTDEEKAMIERIWQNLLRIISAEHHEQRE